MKKSILAIMILACVAFVASPALATPISWVISPDDNSLAFGVTVVNGVLQIGSPDFPGSGSPQPQGIFGAGFTTTGTSFSMNFDSDLYSWDSYNAPTVTGTGWWDGFIVTVSTADYYWNLPHTDPSVASASTFVWGGTNFADGILENYTTAPSFGDSISLSSGSPTTFYVSLVLDTKTLPNSDEQHPSWGSFHVSVVPEPGTFMLLGSGLLSLAFFARRRKE